MLSAAGAKITARWRGSGPPPAIGYCIGPVVDCSGVLPGERTFANIDDFKKLLLADRDQIARNVVEKLLTYATGRRPEFVDRVGVEAILDHTRAGKFGLRALVHEVVQSPLFLYR